MPPAAAETMAIVLYQNLGFDQFSYVQIYGWALDCPHNISGKIQLFHVVPEHQDASIAGEAVGALIENDSCAACAASHF